MNLPADWCLDINTASFHHPIKLKKIHHVWKPNEKNERCFVMFWGQYNLQSDVLSLARMHLWIQFMKTIHLKEIYLLQINSDGKK